MDPVPFKILDVDEMSEVAGRNLLELPYLKANMVEKPDLVEKPDIFCENQISQRQVFKDFGLFRQVNEVSKWVALVSPIYLEHLEESGLTDVMKKLVSYYSQKYPNNWVVFQYNHDNDFARHSWVTSYPNVKIIQFNTSLKTPNDIVVPFWNMNTQQYDEPKKYFAGYIAQMNNPLRVNLMRTLQGAPGYYTENSGNRKYTQDEFYKKCSEFGFNFCPRGVGLSSYRFFETFHLSSVPVLIADHVVLPYEEETLMNYDNLCIRIPESDVHDFGKMNDILGAADQEAMIERGKLARKGFSLFGVQDKVHMHLSLPCEYSG